MSFDPRDYAGVTFDDEHGYTEARERAEREAVEAEEESARELAFRGTPFCEDACYATMTHTVACKAINEPVSVAIGGWLSAVAPRMAPRTAPRMAEIANGIFFPVGDGRKRRRR